MARKNKRKLEEEKESKKELEKISKKIGVPFKDQTPLKEKKNRSKLNDHNELFLTFKTSDFGTEEIAEIISQMSEMYRGLGGDKLVITGFQSFKTEKIPTTVLS